MLLALLSTNDGELAAAAPACDQQPYGPRYWRDIDHVVNVGPDAETSYVDIHDAELAGRLLRGEFDDPHDAAEAVDAYLGLKVRRPR